VEDKPAVFTQEQPEVVIQAAQYLGARVTQEKFFPRWMLNQFARDGLVEVERLIPSTRVMVRVWAKDKTKSESAEVRAPLKKSPKES
jgi:hypothetical protein